VLEGIFMGMDRSAIRTTTDNAHTGTAITELDSIVTGREKKKQPDFKRAKITRPSA